MKKGFFRRGIALLLAAVMVVGMSVSAFAADSDNPTQVTIADGDTPYISFGADLRADEKAKVLELFGLTEADLEKCDVNTVTNAEEHQYLDAYITNDHIGSRALSSVAVMKAKKGSGITVTTKNINYCTTSMYENALATAGVTDANVVVVGPFDMSGTAALIGAVKAYSGMTGKEVDTDVIDGAINEMVVTGEIGDETGQTDEIAGMVAYLKDQVGGKDLSDSELTDAIDQASEKFNVSLTQDQIDQLKELLKKLQGLDLNWSNIRDQAENLYGKLKDMGLKVDTSALTQQAQGFFAKLIAFIKSLFNR
ncbi:DUF1002 domain-containing protein [uncultured Eubacterium sp.]|uniref:DUF1002 domain-containing protein n=1 Tax=uncultured Eubacterium sp. TaxID=165185 RepID=UPI0025F6E348|nr:DUF1002 domain-containing protein [uncultured Eubacterium sp.]MCI6536948.1 DUF1002 domain-containing protein [Lachnospiraceae bacterium]